MRGGRKISILLFILATATAALFIWREECVWTDAQLGPASSIYHNRQCLSQQQTPSLPPPSLHHSSPWTESVMETYSGRTMSKCYCLSILATDFDETKWSITKLFFLFPIYILKILLNIQRDPRCIRNKRREGKEERGRTDIFPIGILVYIYQSRTNEIIEMTPINITQTEEQMMDTCHLLNSS